MLSIGLSFHSVINRVDLACISCECFSFVAVFLGSIRMIRKSPAERAAPVDGYRGGWRPLARRDASGAHSTVRSRAGHARIACFTGVAA